MPLHLKSATCPPRSLSVTSSRPLTAMHRLHRPQRHPSLTVLNDATAKVKGSIKQVHQLLSNVEQSWPSWYPQIVTISRLKGDDATPGAKWMMQHKVAGVEQWTTIQLVLNEPPVAYESRKASSRLVYASASKTHSKTDIFSLMTDPTDPSQTIVRFVSNVKFEPSSWLLQASLSSPLSNVPKVSMKNLEELLSGSNSPLLTSKKGPGSKREASSSSQLSARPSESRRDMDDATPGGGGGGAAGFFKGLGNMFGGGGGGGGKETSRGSSHTNQQVQDLSTLQATSKLDPRGYYAKLGLDPRQARSIKVDEVKVKFRALAQTLHPDKLSQEASAELRLRAEIEFKGLTEAYEVLRDSEKKKEYDQGAAAGL